eukprot:CAMPEP_0178422920 /NCGR_PEP_ID=MMETSP0689_2-20121128/27424_1 /TAXON_ID=160604 /ORGANISM="Amphidinium massartii, Strain CS-259" /LENGTH=62 /DNA_ID=CAMNT_0020044503 /DNA_START=155 /DNA_END=343 /DNA_ORIENTATION=+
MTWQEMLFDVGDEMSLLAAMRKERGKKKGDSSANNSFSACPSSTSSYISKGPVSLTPSAVSD